MDGRPRGRLGAGVLLVVVAAVLGAGCTDGGGEPITLEDFRGRWDVAVRPPLEIEGLEISGGEEENTFRFELPRDAVVEGTVSPDDQTVRSVTIRGASADGGVPEAWTGLLEALVPDLDNEGRGELLRDLGVLDEDGAFAQPDSEQETTRAGWRFTISPANDDAPTLTATFA